MKRIKIWTLLLFLLPGMLLCQEAVVPGKVVDSVPLGSSGFFSYYVPSQYHEEKAWPVIYVFDPAGRDSLAVETFRTAAERYGYIIVASDAIKNGSYQENYKNARELFNRVEERFALDTVNKFTAGFSGGARLAIAIAGLSKDIKGVIASGAGAQNNTINLVRNNPFIFIGLCGDEDFNYIEMKLSGVIFDELKYPNEIIWFEGQHQWPSAQVIEKAVRDLSVIMFSRSQQKRTEEELMQMYAEQMAYNRQLQQEGDLFWAYSDLEKMRDWYSIYNKDGEIKDEMRSIRRNKSYRAQRSDMSYIAEIEPLYLNEYVDFLIEDIAVGDLEALGYWDQELKQFDNTFTQGKKEAYRKMSTRVKSMLAVIAEQAKKELVEPKNYDQLLFTNIFLTLLDPENEVAYLEAMRFAVAKGEYDIALYYTDKLLESGFSDMERLRSYPGITLLRIQPDFGVLLEKYGFESRF
ncbi:alpha/beta hydrolase [Robertkochia flava]|uniref:alpha/beta hydrolase n=1 Tax=Robertkochia flava TaxID=3447986 RepID=UPI001CC976EF|nr:alpha/beta hydrolase [Robertkochia marina]